MYLILDQIKLAALRESEADDILEASGERYRRISNKPKYQLAPYGIGLLGAGAGAGIGALAGKGTGAAIGGGAGLIAGLLGGSMSAQKGIERDFARESDSVHPSLEGRSKTVLDALRRRQRGASTGFGVGMLAGMVPGMLVNAKNPDAAGAVMSGGALLGGLGGYFIGKKATGEEDKEKARRILMSAAR